jgi:hypothetical protein
MNYNPNDVTTWPLFKPLIIAHDVARSRDRSTAVVGGNSPCGRPLIGIHSAEELPQNLFGSALASALMKVDAAHHRNALIVADLSNESAYAEVLHQTFGQRVIGVHIARFGDGMTCERRQVPGGWLPIYTIGRTVLLDLYLAEVRAGQVRFADQPTMRKAYQQLANLEVELRESGKIYKCPPGHHDDLGISCAMLAWAARHLHLTSWLRNLEAARRPRIKRDSSNWAEGWT